MSEQNVNERGQPLAAPLCSALASCPLLPCPECGSDGYVPHDAWDMVRCGNWNCRLHKIPNVLSREQWQMAPRNELVAYAKKLESAALELEALQQTPEEAKKVHEAHPKSGFSLFRKWKKETEEGKFADSLCKHSQDVRQAVVAAWVAGRESADAPRLELVQAIFEAGYRWAVKDSKRDVLYIMKAGDLARCCWKDEIACRIAKEDGERPLEVADAQQWENTP